MNGTKRFAVVNSFDGEVLYTSNYYLECIAFQQQNDNNVARVTAIVDNKEV